MNKLLITAALIAATVATGAMKATAADFSDRTEYTCDNEEIKAQMEAILLGNPANTRIIYAKDAKEVSRSSDELRCRVTLVTNSGSSTGVFRYWNQDGHSLVKFSIGAKK